MDAGPGWHCLIWLWVLFSSEKWYCDQFFCLQAHRTMPGQFFYAKSKPCAHTTHFIIINFHPFETHIEPDLLIDW